MLHFVTSYMKQNKSLKQTLESAQYGLEISFKPAMKVVTALAWWKRGEPYRLAKGEQKTEWDNYVF